MFAGTPIEAWLDYELAEVFGVPYKLDGTSAQYIYDHILERLQSPEYRPRALFERFNIELLTTTDAATDTLAFHQAIRASGWTGRVVPCFRPDAVFKIARQTGGSTCICWSNAVARPSQATRTLFARIGAAGGALSSA